MRSPSYGPDGAGALRRVYRRSLLRHAFKIAWTHRGLCEQDVMVASHPRAGSLWLRFMLISLLGDEASIDKVVSSAPYVGLHRSAPRLLPSGAHLVKTHEQYQSRYRRAIHLVRDPRDSAVSYFALLRGEGRLSVPTDMDPAQAFDRYLDSYIGGRLDAYGTWQQHLLSWRNAAHEGRVDLITGRYEDMRAAPADEIERIAGWLGLRPSDADLARAVDSATIDLMSAAAQRRWPPDRASRWSVRAVVNQGLVGGYQSVLTPAQVRKFDAFADGLRLMGYAES